MPFLDEAPEEFVECLEVDELRRLVPEYLLKIVENALLYVFDARGVVPKFLEPAMQVDAVAVVRDDEVEFDVVVRRRESESAGGKVRAADDRGRHLATMDVRHLAVQESGARDGPDFDLVANPRSAGLCEVALVQATRQREPVVAQHAGSAVGFLRVDAVDERGLTEQQANTSELIEVGAQPVVGEDRKVGGDEIEIRIGSKLCSEEIGDGTASVVITDARSRARRRHANARYVRGSVGALAYFCVPYGRLAQVRLALS